MKKALYTVLFAILLAASFLAGSWHKDHKPLNVGLPGAESKAFGAEGESVCEEEPAFDASSLPPGTIRISPERQQMIGVRTGRVEKAELTRNLRLLGRVAPDEDRIFQVKAAVDGIIREVFPGTTGSSVKKGQPLATYYSPDIYAAQQGYIIALSSERYRNNLQVQVTESRLQFLGMSASQIEKLKKEQQIDEVITLHSPATGFVISRAVSRDLRFLKGEELYRIADLNRVWIYADIYENEARYLLPHVKARISHPQLAKAFQAEVSDVLSLFDAGSRTLKVRLEVENADFLLKPDMFVDIELPITLPPSLFVPADAVLDSGLRKIVFIDKGNGIFEPREVETGSGFDNRVEIKAGIEPGERIALSGTFLIDSESRMELAASGVYETPRRVAISDSDASANKAKR